MKILSEIELRGFEGGLYDIFWAGRVFKALLSQEDEDGNLPIEVTYHLKKSLDDITEGEKSEILAYRGLTLADGFSLADVFMQAEYISTPTLTFNTPSFGRVEVAYSILESASNEVVEGITISLDDDEIIEVEDISLESVDMEILEEIIYNHLNK